MTSTTPALARSRDDRVIAGVCAGLGAHLGVPVKWVRVGMAVFALLGGAGAMFYIWLWVLAPPEGEGQVAPMRRVLTRPAAGTSAAAATGAPTAVPTSVAGAGAIDGSAAVASAAGSAAAAPGLAAAPGPASAAAGTAAASATEQLVDRARRWPIAEFLLGACLLVAGFGLVLVQLGVQLRLDMLLPGMAVLVGVGLTWWQIADRDRPERNLLPRVLGALALVAVGVLMFFVTAQQPSMLTVVGAAVAVLAGVALALAPWALRVNRELIAERSARAREAERAEIAAHLHDSVLQTLAAIQQRSEPGSDVARLARGQERDLREWLFRTADGAPPVDREALDVELRQHAAALEAEHAVRFEVISVGARCAVPEAIVAAAREAMLNAARHAGGEVTVYVETRPEKVSIDITDRGSGIDLDRLPEGRMGVRESIIGRMQRAGGSASYAPGPGRTGTAVRLSLPLQPEEETSDE